MTVSALKELGMLPDYVLNKVFLVTIKSSTISLALVTQSTVVDWILKEFAIIYTIAWLHYPTFTDESSISLNTVSRIRKDILT